MFRQFRIESIDFKTFMAGNHRKPRRFHSNAYSFFPSITMTSFLSPDIAGLYAVVLGAGAIVMLSHGLESYAAHSGHVRLATAIETVTRLAFPVVGFGFILFFLISL